VADSREGIGVTAVAGDEDQQEPDDDDGADHHRESQLATLPRTAVPTRASGARHFLGRRRFTHGCETLEAAGTLPESACWRLTQFLEDRLVLCGDRGR